MLENLSIPIPIIKFLFGFFFLLYFTFYDVFYGKIPNKGLILMLIVGLIINYFSLDFWKEILATIFITFTFSYILWELGYLNPGDVKLLTILPLFLPYSTGINPMESVFVILIFVIATFFTYLLIKKASKDKSLLKETLKEYLNYLRNINYIALFSIVFSLSVLLYFWHLDFVVTLVLILVLFLIIDELIQEEIKAHIFLLLFVISIFVFFKFDIYNDKIFYYNLAFILLLILFLRSLLYISSYFVSTKTKRVEELKEGDKLALVPVKINEKYQLMRVIPYNIFSLYFIKKHAIDNYDPSLGLEKSNINKIKKFFKLNHIIKVKVFEEIPFLPFLLFTYIIFYAYFFFTYFSHF